MTKRYKRGGYTAVEHDNRDEDEYLTQQQQLHFPRRFLSIRSQQLLDLLRPVCRRLVIGTRSTSHLPLNKDQSLYIAPFFFALCLSLFCFLSVLLYSRCFPSKTRSLQFLYLFSFLLGSVSLCLYACVSVYVSIPLSSSLPVQLVGTKDVGQMIVNPLQHNTKVFFKQLLPSQLSIYRCLAFHRISANLFVDSVQSRNIKNSQRLYTEEIATKMSSW